MKIGEVSKQFNISIPTLRYYESVGLIDHIKKNQSGIREYNEDDLKRISFVCCMRNAGISIDVLIEYLNLYKQGDATALKRIKLLECEKEKIQNRINDLISTKERLDMKIEWTRQNIKR